MTHVTVVVVPSAVFEQWQGVRVALPSSRYLLHTRTTHVPVVEVESGDTDLMDRVVEVAASLAQQGDTVLLAPGCASWDQFRNYSARGDAFTAAVEGLRSRS